MYAISSVPSATMLPCMSLRQRGIQALRTSPDTSVVLSVTGMDNRSNGRFAAE